MEGLKNVGMIYKECGKVADKIKGSFPLLLLIFFFGKKQ